MGQEVMTPESVLERFWGFASFRSFQRRPVHDLTQGRSVVAVLPTGGGKSLCYQVPGIVRGGLCIVVSPLIALMKDQVLALRKRQIRAEYWTSEGGKREAERVLNNVTSGRIQFLYLAPERLQNEMFLAHLPRMDVRTIAIDEAHCISQWGHDFRPQYLNIREFLRLLPNAAVGAYTATATSSVLTDISAQLGLEGTRRYRAPLRRPNLHFATIHSTDGDAALLEAAADQQGTGLVYVSTRIQAEVWANRLTEMGIQAAAYHAGMTTEEKARHLTGWLKGEIQAMACTSAFGMGIDKPDVRWVFHAHIPADIESYVQEAGRAGRDGLASICYLFPSANSLAETSRRLKQRFPNHEVLREVYQALANVSQSAPGDLPEDWFAWNVADWVARNGRSAHDVHASMNLFQSSGWIQWKTTGQNAKSRASLLITPRQCHDLCQDMGPERQLLEAIARSPLGELSFSLATWAGFLNWPVERLESSLHRWDGLGWIEWHPPGKGLVFQWRVPRQSTDSIRIPRSIYEERRSTLLSKWSDMQAFLATKSCRSSFIEAYFGEEASPSKSNCGICDECQKADVSWEAWVRDEIPKEGRNGLSLLKACPLPLRSDLVHWLTHQRHLGRIRCKGPILFREFA